MFIQNNIYIMSNISKIKLSGTTYTLKDNNATKTSEVTQAQYDALVSAGTVDTNTFYIITDATPVDISNYYTSAQTNAAITAAVSGKVDTSAITSSVTSASTDTEIPTAKAVYDAIPTGGTGGGKAIEAGRGISITTGETADTVSFSLPISAGTGTDSLKIAGTSSTVASGNRSIAVGNNANAYGMQSVAINQSTANGQDSFSQGTSYAQKAFSSAFGQQNYSNNSVELSCGQYNNSVSASTTFGDSGNTLFSVGNGTANNARHNAFEIRQNGDIYITLDGQDVKLQDQLGGGGSASSAITSGDTNAVAGGAVYDRFDEVEQVTARALNELSEADEVAARALVDLDGRFGGLKLVKITQSAYDALTTKDSNTLYVITS